ncbi:hypothetical protein NM22_04400, partial [Vibrio tubiashii]
SATIQDEADLPVVESISSFDVEEGSTGTFTVELSNPSQLETDVTMSLRDGSAMSVDGQPDEGDYNASSVLVKFSDGTSETIPVSDDGDFTVTVPQNVKSFTVDVKTNDDGHTDDREHFSLSGKTAQQDTAEVGVATILDNEAPTLDLNGAQYDIQFVSEGAGYSNVFGYYIYDENSDTQQLHVLIGNNNDPSLTPGSLLDSPLSSIDNIEFFLIPGGAHLVMEDDFDKLELNADGELIVDGRVKEYIDVYKSTDDDHQMSRSVDAEGNLVFGFDDQKGNDRDDDDFDDIVIKIVKSDPADIDHAVTFMEGDKDGVAIATSDADIFDDKDTIESMTVTLAKGDTNDVLTWDDLDGFVVETIESNDDTYAVKVSYVGDDGYSQATSAAEFESFLTSIRFGNSSATPGEVTRTVEVQVFDGVNTSVTATTSITVIDLPTVESISSFDVEEGSTGTFTVELSNASQLETDVTMSLRDGSAMSVDGQPDEGDYNASSVLVKFSDGTSETIPVSDDGDFTVTVPQNVKSFTVDVKTNDDGHTDDREHFSLSGKTAQQDTAEVGVATILDNEAPTLDLNGAQYDIQFVSEGAGYSNVFGYYIYDENSDTQQLHVLIGNNNDPSLTPGSLLDSPLSSIDNIEFFLIPGGAHLVMKDDFDKLELNADGELIVDGRVKEYIDVYKSTDDDHQMSRSVDAEGNLVFGFDDQKGNDRDDDDFDDIVIKIVKSDPADIDHAVTFVEGDQDGVAIATSDADIFDDKDTIESMTVTLANAKADDVLSWVDFGGFKVTPINTATTYALLVTHPSGAVSAAGFETILKSISFVNDSDTPDETPRIVEVQVSDGVHDPVVATTTISVIGTEELSFNTAVGLEDNFISLGIAVADADTSVETIDLTGIPKGAVVSVQNVETTIGDSGSITVSIDDIQTVKVKAPEHSDVNFDVTIIAKNSGAEVIETGRLTVDVHPDADAPTLTLGEFAKVAAIDFEDVTLDTAWDAEIAINTVKGASTIGEWETSNAGNHVEVGTEGTYLPGTSTNQVMEIEGNNGDKVLYTDMDLVAGRFYKFEFDIAARSDNKPADSDMEVTLVKLDQFGQPIPDSEVKLYDFIADRVGTGWQKGEFTLPVETTGKYRLLLEADEADSTGAIIDNINFLAVDNLGYEGTPIKLSEIHASLVDKEDSSEKLTIELTGIPVGSVISDGSGANTYEVTEANKDQRIEVTSWNLSELQVIVPDPAKFDIQVIATAIESDTNKDQHTQGDHADAGGSLTAESKTSITVEVLERPEGGSNDLPEAGSFDVISDHSVVEVQFADNATDTEDDPDASKVTKVQLTELPEHGDLYYFDVSSNQFVKVTESDLTGSNPLVFADNTKVFYVADRDAQAVHEIDTAELSAAGDGVKVLELDGMSISGGRIENGTFVEGTGAIKYDGTNKQQGVFVSTDKNEGLGEETSAGEFISIASDKGNISSISLQLASLQGLLGNNAHAKVVAYLFDNGQSVGDPIDLSISVPHPNPDHTGSATLSSSDSFDEVRLTVVNTSNGGQGAGFNLSGVEMTVNGEVAITDEFKYLAIDSDDQVSASEGTVHVEATNRLADNGAGVDSVFAQGSNGYTKMDWQTSAATIFESENHRTLDYDPVKGVVIDTGIAGDKVDMGSGADTVYLGDSHSPGQDINYDVQEADIQRFAESSIDALAYGGEDGATTFANSANAGMDVAHGGGGNDHIYGEGGSDLIFGGTGHDVLDGGDGNDAVRGGSDNDTIIGGLGDDILVGDDGADIFKWVDMATEHDRVVDFSRTDGDQLDLSDLFEDVSKEEITELLSELSSATEGETSAVKVSVTEDNGTSTMTIEKGVDTLTIDFNGASAADITSSLIDNLEHLKD